MKNIAASVRARLHAIARQSDRTFNELLQYYGIERLLYRLSKSKYADGFVLKGALLFFGLGIDLRRPTRDIDLRGYENNTIANIENIFRHICGIVVEDGLHFDPESVKAERIIEDADYEGMRVRFSGRLGKAIIYMQVDIGFSDQLAAQPDWIDYPTLLDMPSPRIRAYPLESMISEKFEAIVALGLANSRLKDFYDLYVASEVFEVHGDSLTEAIATTFPSRNTPIPEDVPEGLSTEFVDRKRKQWQVFVQRLVDNEAELELDKVVDRLRQFLLPAAEAARVKSRFQYKWRNNIWERTG